MNKPIVSCRKHWIAMVPTGVLSLLFLIAAPSVKEWYVCVLLAVVIFGVDFLIVRSDRLVLTATDITGRTGVIKTVKLAAPISRVQDVAISNGLLGKILGYHTITVSTAGTDHREFVFKGVSNAEEFQRKFLELAAHTSAV